MADILPAQPGHGDDDRRRPARRTLCPPRSAPAAGAVRDVLTLPPPATPANETQADEYPPDQYDHHPLGS